jgi:transposase
MPNDTTRIEIITGRERRRRYSAEQKLRLVEETSKHPARTAVGATQSSGSGRVVVSSRGRVAHLLEGLFDRTASANASKAL